MKFIYIFIIFHFITFTNHSVNAQDASAITHEIEERNRERFLVLVRNQPILPGHRITIDPGFSPSEVEPPHSEGCEGNSILPCTFTADGTARKVEIDAPTFRNWVYVTRYTREEAECIRLAWAMSQKGDHQETWQKLTHALLDRSVFKRDAALSILAHAIPRKQNCQSDLETLAQIQKHVHTFDEERKDLKICNLGAHEATVVDEQEVKTFLSPIKAFFSPFPPKTPKRSGQNAAASPKNTSTEKRGKAHRNLFGSPYSPEQVGSPPGKKNARR